MTSTIGKPKGRPAPNNFSRGFTLIEIMLVVLTLFFVLAMAIPRFQGTFESLKIRVLANDLHSLLLYAQERAILDRDFYRVVYRENEKQVRLERKEKGKFVPVTGRRGKPLKLDEKSTLSWSGRGKEITFGPEGESDKTKIIFSHNNRPRFVIKVGEPQGRIAFEENK